MNESAGWKLVEDFHVGDHVLFRGSPHVIFALGDTPGTFDIQLPSGSGDRWTNVPPSALTYAGLTLPAVVQAEPDLSQLDALAKVYASSYASPHHVTFTVEGLRNLIASLDHPAAPQTNVASPAPFSEPRSIGQGELPVRAEMEPVAYCHLSLWATGKFWPDECFSDSQAEGMSPLYASPPVQQGVVEALTSAREALLIKKAALSQLSPCMAAECHAESIDWRDGADEAADGALGKIDAALASLRPPAPLMEKQ